MRSGNDEPDSVSSVRTGCQQADAEMDCTQKEFQLSVWVQRRWCRSVSVQRQNPTDHQSAKLGLMAVFLLIALSSRLNAQEQPEPTPRFDVTPFLGYRTSMSFPVEPHVTGTNPRVVIDANPSYGIAFPRRDSDCRHDAMILDIAILELLHSQLAAIASLLCKL